MNLASNLSWYLLPCIFIWQAFIRAKSWVKAVCPDCTHEHSHKAEFETGLGRCWSTQSVHAHAWGEDPCPGFLIWTVILEWEAASPPPEFFERKPTSSEKIKQSWKWVCWTILGIRKLLLRALAQGAEVCSYTTYPFSVCEGSVSRSSLAHKLMMVSTRLWKLQLFYPLGICKERLEGQVAVHHTEQREGDFDCLMKAPWLACTGSFVH